MTFIKHKKDFYVSMQVKNSESFDMLSKVYFDKLLAFSKKGLTQDILVEMVKESQKAFDELAMLNFQELSEEYIRKLRSEVLHL